MFLVNVPIGVLGVVLAPLLVAETRTQDGGRRLDVAGAMTVTAALALLVLGLTRGGAAGLLAVAAGLALLALFARIEARARDPLLPPALLRARGFVPANVVAAVLTAATTPPLLLCVLELQNEGGSSPLETGLLFAPVNLAVIAGSLLGPRLARAVGVASAMAMGLAAVAAGVLWLAAVGAGEPLALLPAFVVLGAGLGCAAVASTMAGTDAAGPARAGVASGVLNTAAQVGTALGLAALVALAGAAGDRWAFAAAAALALSGVGVARQLSS